MPYYQRHSSVSSRSRSPARRPLSSGHPPLKRDPPSRCSLLVRNLPKGTTEGDLRYPAEKFGPVRDVYLPRDYHTGELRGIGFIQFKDPRDAKEAICGLHRTVILDNEITVVLAKHGRKRPEESLRVDMHYRYRDGDRRRRSRSPPKRRSRTRSYSRRRGENLSPRRKHRHSNSDDIDVSNGSKSTGSKRSNESRSVYDIQDDHDLNWKKSSPSLTVYNKRDVTDPSTETKPQKWKHRA
eukprot:g3707.t1